ncbi:MAG TPA: bacillithiol biosynthesis cysteine-adding enzyme BshC [Pyrinomonadaceae bacterium]|nr:bacillithiol biosynthesis cysteine-adding enzyme BshC [Pyrinomonadaceae bacterium]
MMQETDCPPTASKSKLRFEAVDFADIPGQSELFRRYQSDPLSLREYYPSAVRSHADVAARIPEVLDAYSVDRRELADILADQNRRFGAGAKAIANIELLRRDDTVAVLTGQQAGLFTGPLYTIYKALSAIKMAECFRGRGLNAVPIFWAATEDHDFEEISRALVLDGGAEQVEFQLARSDDSKEKPVGSIRIPDSFADELRKHLSGLPKTEFTDDLGKTLSENWAPGRTIAEAFASHIQSLFEKYGLIVVDPLDVRLKKLAAPIYAAAVEQRDSIVGALVSRSQQLQSDGFQPQVLVTPDYFPLFYHTDDGVRRSVRQKGDGVYRVSDTKLEFSSDELGKIALAEPARFSPGVMLRPVVQDYLFPTVCYLGGGAEIAYFAQNSEVYRTLGRPVTTILQRQGFTIVEAKQARTLEKYDLEFVDLFGGFENLLPGIVERFVNPSSARLFADSEENINLQLNRLDQDLSKIDPTLAANLATRRRKILYHIGALQKKFHKVQIERDEILHRQLRSLFASLLPDGHLQERKLNVASFTSRYGPYFIDWLYDSIDLEERGHRLLYL